MPPKGTLSVEEELADLQRRFALLESDRKTYYESSVWTMKQNRDTIAQMKKENKELRQTMSATQRSSSATPTLPVDSVNSDLDLNEQICSHRKRFDEYRHVTAAKQKEVQTLQEKLKQLSNESRKPTADDTPLMRQIRQLENRLDKAMIKYNEAQSIRKTYEQIVKRLKEERVGFDNQLSAIEKTLKAKEHDYEELLLLSHDANHAKEMAQTELARFEAQVAEERRQREKEVHERKLLVQARAEMNQKMEQKEKQKKDKEDEDKPESRAKNTANVSTFQQAIQQNVLESEKQKIQDYEEAFRRIKEATGVSDVNEVIQKFLTQEDTQNNLMELTKENQGRIEMLNDEKLSLKARVEEIKYSGSGNMGRRQIVDDFEAHLTEATNKCERNRLKYERVAKILINVKAGIDHLNDKLETIKLDNVPNIAMTDETIVEVLTQAEQKLLSVLVAMNAVIPAYEPPAQMSDYESADEQPPSPSRQPAATGASSGTGNNVRIRLPEGEERESEDDELEEELDEDVPNRRSVKYSSQAMLDKQQKKTRKTRKTKTSKRSQERA
eukprot:GILK01001635.1.p1 GENE.GILK01001635.1~~GILK01001635.1.p1  ORF type:complete len:555 (-),score=144.99 GILK01001635.1:170-1834(-)